MRAGALVSPCHVMAGLVPAIHVFARSSTDLAERDARNKSGHDERSGRTGETARLTQSHANFRIGTLARLSNQGCGLRGDFWPHREGNGAPGISRPGVSPRRAGRRPRWATAGPSAQPATGSVTRAGPLNTRSCSAPEGPDERPIVATSVYSASKVPAIPDGTTPVRWVSEVRVEVRLHDPPSSALPPIDQETPSGLTIERARSLPAAPLMMFPCLSVRDQSECPENWSIVPCTVLGVVEVGGKCRRGAESAVPRLLCRAADRSRTAPQPALGRWPCRSHRNGVMSRLPSGPWKTRNDQSSVAMALTAPPSEVHELRIVDQHVRRAARWTERPGTGGKLKWSPVLHGAGPWSAVAASSDTCRLPLAGSA